MGILGRWCAVLCVVGLTAGCSLIGDENGTSKSSDPNVQPITSGESELAELTLRPEELPAGYEFDPIPEDDAEGSGYWDDYECGVDDPWKLAPPEEEHTVSYSSGGQPPLVVNTVAQFADEATAKEFMTAVAAYTETCLHSSRTDPFYLEVTFEEVPLPGVGDDAIYTKASSPTGIGVIAFDQVYARVGDRVLHYMGWAFDSVDAALTKSLSKLVADRM